MDPDPDRYRIQPKMLDPDPYQMNTDPKIIYFVPCVKVLRLEKEDSELLEMRRKALESLMKKTMKTKQLKAGLE